MNILKHIIGFQLSVFYGEIEFHSNCIMAIIIMIIFVILLYPPFTASSTDQ
jgi:hypothetical protein